MKILLLSTYFRPDIASTGVIMSKLADEFVARGHQVTVLTSVPHYDTNQVWPEFSRKLIHTEDSGNLRIHRMFTYVARDKANVFQRILAYGSFNLLSILKGLTLPRQDVILAPSPPLSNGVIADLLSRLRGIPFVYNVQDIWPDVAIRAGVLKNAKVIQRLARMESYVYRRAAAISVISEGFRGNLLAKSVPDDKLSVIPNFIDTDFITPRPKLNPFSQRHQLEDKFVVLFAGNMGFSQSLETVVDAAQLLQEHGDIEFLMVGNGAGRASAQAHLERLKLKNIRFLPFQPEKDVPDMYASADVCLIPLRRGFSAESTPCKVFSIMAAGRPSVASVDPGSDTYELITRTRTGTCVEPDNAGSIAQAILGYYHDESRRRDTGTNARSYVEAEFRPAGIAEKYLEVLERAIKRGGRTAD